MLSQFYLSKVEAKAPFLRVYTDMCLASCTEPFFCHKPK